jgi:hypothetical protein
MKIAEMVDQALDHAEENGYTPLLVVGLGIGWMVADLIDLDADVRAYVNGSEEGSVIAAIVRTGEVEDAVRSWLLRHGRVA